MRSTGASPFVMRYLRRSRCRKLTTSIRIHPEDLGRRTMGASIEYVCSEAHERRDAGAVTIVDGRWAYCACGAAEEHTWVRITPTELGQLRAPGHGARHEGAG